MPERPQVSLVEGCTVISCMNPVSNEVHSYPAGICVCFRPLPEQIPYDFGVQWNIMPALPIKLAEDPEPRKS